MNKLKIHTVSHEVMKGLFLCFIMCSIVNAADWPTHNGDVQRRGYVEEELQFPLNTQWVSHNALPNPLFRKSYVKKPGRPSITYDYSPQVISVDEKVFFNSPMESCVRCIDQNSGKEIWAFYANAPVRLSPTYADGRILFGSDDGFAYCVDANTGEEIWRYSPLDRQRWCIGNGRFTSQWPCRTGVTVKDGIAYFAMGLFPTNGVYVCAVNVADSSVVWKSELDEDYATAFQGHIMIDGDVMYIPTGDTSPVEFDLQTGNMLNTDKLRYRRSTGGVGAVALGDDVVAYGPIFSGIYFFRATLTDTEKWNKQSKKFNSKMRGRSIGIFGDKFICAKDRYYFLRVMDSGRMVEMPNGYEDENGLYGQTLFSLKKDEFKRSLQESVLEEKRKYPNYWAARFPLQEDKGTVVKIPPCMNWKQNVSQSSLNMQACANAVIIGSNGAVVAYDFQSGEKVWEEKVDGEVWDISIANGAIIAATDTGKVYCFGEGPSVPSVETVKPAMIAQAEKPFAAYALDQTERKKGFCLVLDAGGHAELLYELATTSSFHVIGLESDLEKANMLKSELKDYDAYGSSMSIHHCSADKLSEYLSWFANIVVMAEDKSAWAEEEINRLIRPYGGVLVARQKSSFSQLEEQGSFYSFVRGALPGAGNWGHLYANTANTLNGEDELVGGSKYDITWYGPPGTERIINRHMVPMGPVSYNGLLFVFSKDYITAVDNYNGTILWEKEIPHSSRVLMPFQAAPICADERYVYVISGDSLLLLDVATGETRETLVTESSESDWGYVGYSKDFIIASYQNVKARCGPGKTKGWNWDQFHRQNKVRKEIVFNHPVVSTEVSVYDKKGHEKRWTHKGLVVNSTITIDGDVMYFYETRNPAADIQIDGTLGLDVIRKNLFLVSLDLKSGKVLWEKPFASKATDVLFLCKKDDLLLTTESWFVDKKTVFYRLVSMNPSTGQTNWDVEDKNRNPYLRNESNHNQALMHPTIIDGKIVMRYYGYIGVFQISDGEVSYIEEGYRCSVGTASATNLFYRNSSIYTYDFVQGKSSAITKITRPTCWVSILPVGGVLLMPEYQSTSCVCGYPLKISIAKEAIQ